MTQFGLHITPEEAYMHEGRHRRRYHRLLAQRCWGRKATEEEKQTIYKAKSDGAQPLPGSPANAGRLRATEKVKAGGFTPMVVTGSGQISLIDWLNHNFPDIFRRELMVTKL